MFGAKFFFFFLNDDQAADSELNMFDQFSLSNQHFQINTLLGYNKIYR